MRHKTAYQKANAALEAEGHRQCGILYGSTALALSRHWGKGRVAILNLFDVTGEVWHTCASTNLHSMIEMCETESRSRTNPARTGEICPTSTAHWTQCR